MDPIGKVHQWMEKVVPGKSFVDIGGIGGNSLNERVSFASKCGASRATLADIRPLDYREWKTFRARMKELGVEGVEEVGDIDIRHSSSLKKLGKQDVVYSTGIFYHLSSPPDAFWNLRSVVGEYLITNTITIPNEISNEYGTLRTPDAGVLFLAALTETERAILRKYYSDNGFRFNFDQLSPRLGDPNSPNQWITETGELAPWPNWWFYSDHAFRSLAQLCRFEIIDETKWRNHTLFLFCRRLD